jgi:hypothetical protein
LANLGSELEKCVGSSVRLVGVSISFEKNFYRLPFTPPSLVRRIGPSEFYESDSSVEADKDTDVEAGDDAGAGPGAGGVPKCRTRSTVGKRQASSVAVVVSAVKAAEQKKIKKRRRASFPPMVTTLSIPTPRSREIKSEEEEEDQAIEELANPEEQPTKRPESPTTKRQRELVQKTSKDALRRGLELQRAAATAQARMAVTIRPRVFKPKARIPIAMR